MSNCCSFGAPSIRLLTVCRRDRVKYEFALICALALSACADEDTTAPRRSSKLELLPNATHQLVGGTFSLPIPGTSAAPQLGGAPWHATGFKVIRGVNVRVSMPSTMTATYNTPPPENWTCIPPYVPNGDVNPGFNPFPGQSLLGTIGYTITPDAAGTVGSNPTVYGSWTQVSGGGWAGVAYHGSESPDSGYLSFRRHELDGQCNSFVKYTLAGDQTITVDFPEIQVIPDRAFILSGASVHFAASASGFSPAANTWAWTWKTGTGSVNVSGCQSSQCDYSPSTTGYMLVAATGTDNLVYGGQSGSVTVVTGPGAISLSCPASVVRAVSISCTASPPAGGTLAVTGWSFASSVGNYHVKRSNDTTNTVWGGKLVVSGTVMVAGSISGVPGYGTAVVQVQPRNWVSDTTPRSHTVQTPLTGPQFSSRPIADSLLGHTVLFLPFDSQNPERWLAPTIGDNGPNQGFGYLIALPPKPASESGVNTKAINDTSGFYLIQENKRKKIGSFWFCPKSTVTGVLQNLVARHEGAFPQAQLSQHPYSHPRVFQHWVDSLSRLRFESVAAPQDVMDIETIRAQIDTVASFWADSIPHMQQYNYVNYTSLGNCDHFHYDYSSLPP
ncbi:MAG TPA: hypothetical protein VJ717_17875 [Gemmatimonadaceae bacterium]|nr:hypothetical protein [Gemmatimonadaceae bacterium]